MGGAQLLLSSPRALVLHFELHLHGLGILCRLDLPSPLLLLLLPRYHNLRIAVSSTTRPRAEGVGGALGPRRGGRSSAPGSPGQPGASAPSSCGLAPPAPAPASPAFPGTFGSPHALAAPRQPSGEQPAENGSGLGRTCFRCCCCCCCHRENSSVSCRIRCAWSACLSRSRCACSSACLASDSTHSLSCLFRTSSCCLSCSRSAARMASCDACPAQRNCAVVGCWSAPRTLHQAI